MGVKVKEKVKGSGVWWVFVHHQGRKKTKCVGPKKKADEVAAKVAAKIALGEFNLLNDEKPQQTFKEIAENWIATTIKPFKKPTTYERYNGLLKSKIIPAIGKLPIEDIKRSHIRKLLADLNNKGYGKSSLNLVRDVVSGAFEHAIDDEIISVNPTRKILKRLGLERDPAETIDPLEQEEMDLFLETCHKHFNDWYVFFLTAFRTGMRIGELLGLKWGDINWKYEYIRVQRSHRRGVTSEAKTKKSRRNVDMSDQLATALRSLLTKRKRQALASGKPMVEWIHHNNGKPFEQNKARREFKKVLKKAGLHDVRVHDCRHTYATLLLSAGVSPVYVKDQLGHTSIKMTVDIYGAWIRTENNRKIVNLLDGDTAPTCPHAAPESTKAP